MNRKDFIQLSSIAGLSFIFPYKILDAAPKQTALKPTKKGEICIYLDGKPIALGKINKISAEIAEWKEMYYIIDCEIYSFEKEMNCENIDKLFHYRSKLEAIIMGKGVKAKCKIEFHELDMNIPINKAMYIDALLTTKEIQYV